MAGTQYRGSEITDVDQFVNEASALSARKKSGSTLAIAMT